MKKLLLILLLSTMTIGCQQEVEVKKFSDEELKYLESMSEFKDNLELETIKVEEYWNDIVVNGEVDNDIIQPLKEAMEEMYGVAMKGGAIHAPKRFKSGHKFFNEGRTHLMKSYTIMNTWEYDGTYTDQLIDSLSEYKLGIKYMGRAEESLMKTKNKIENE